MGGERRGPGRGQEGKGRRNRREGAEQVEGPTPGGSRAEGRVNLDSTHLITAVNELIITHFYLH